MHTIVAFIRDFLRVFWRWWAILCGIFGLLFICLITISLLHAAIHYSEDRKKYEEGKFGPLIKYVESFRDLHGRLPTKPEFDEWAHMSPHNYYGNACYYPEKPSFMSDWGVTNQDFVVGSWCRDWWLYCRSWDKKTFTNDKEPN
jgi:hypothetical protein